MKLIDILQCTDHEDEFLIFYDNVSLFCGKTKSDILVEADFKVLTATVKKIIPVGYKKSSSKLENYALHIDLVSEQLT